MLKFIKSRSENAIISTIVVFFHLLLLYSLFMQFPIPSKPLKKPKLRVHTASLQQPNLKPEEKSVIEKKETLNSAIQANPNPKVEKVEKKEVPAKIEKKETPIKKEAKVIKKEIVKEKPKKIDKTAQANKILAELDNAKKNISKSETSKLPTLEGIKFQEEETAFQEAHYSELIAQKLKNGLKLPEIGEVKIELTIAQNGTVEKLRIIDSKSVKNQNYVEKTIPRLTFPPLRGNFKNLPNKMFEITLTG